MHCKIHEGGLCSACSKLAQVQLKIQQCKDLLDELYVQEARVKSCVNEAHDPIICRLPLELVSYIFTLCDPQQAEDQPSRRFQFDLAAVSNTWRTIVWSTPQLWTKIHIWLDTPEICRQTELLPLFLKLSGSLPLLIQVRLYTYYNPMEKDYPFLASLLQMLNQHSARWEALDLRLPSRLLALVNGVLPGAPQLQILRIIPRDSGNPHEQADSGFRILGCPPCPSDISVNGIRFSQLGIDWINVTTVKFHPLRPDECLELFKCAKRLMECEIVLDASVVPDRDVIRDEIALPSLRTLRMRLSAFADIIFDALVLPSLNNLHLERSARCMWLVNFLVRSSCTLLSLSLVDIHLDGIEMVSILEQAPQLEILRLSRNSVHFDNLFERLAHTKTVDKSSQDLDTTCDFLPCLRSLRCDQSRDMGFPWHLIPPMFASAPELENSGFHSLCKLRISLHSGDPYLIGRCIDKSVVRQLWELKQHYQLTICDEDGDVVERSYKHHFPPSGRNDTSGDSDVVDEAE